MMVTSRKYIPVFSTLVLLFIFSCFRGNFALAADNPKPKTEISSDSLEYDKNAGIYYMKGNVVLTKGDLYLYSRYAEYHEKTSEVLLVGDVTYIDKDVIMNAEKAEINTDRKTGTLYNGSVLYKKDNLHVDATVIQRTGANSYVIENASLTTCDASPPPWSFNAKKADVIVGKRLTAGDVVFRIRDFPVLYTPYLWAPVLTERTTGLLFPSIGYSNRLGFSYGQPFFIVLSGNRDMTLVPEYFSQRGFGEGLEYRYVEKGGIAGRWWLYHIRDSVLDKDIFELKAIHSQYSAEGFSHFLNLNLINNREYYHIYKTQVDTRFARFLESTGSASYQSDPLRLHLSAQYWYDLKMKDDSVINRLPTAGITMHPTSLGPLAVSLDSAATNFYALDGFNVQRYSISPSVSNSIGSKLRLDQTLRATGVYYENSNAGDNFPSGSQRGILEYSAGLDTAIQRRYSGFTHVIQPEARFNYVTDSGFDAPQLDSLETITDLTNVVFTLRNDLIGKEGLFLSFRVLQPYNLRGDDAHPLGPTKFDLFLSTRLYLSLEAEYGPYTGKLETMNGSSGFSLLGARVSAGQRYGRINHILFYTGGLSFDVSKKIKLDNTVWYDARGAGLQNLTSVLTYTSQCWGIALTFDEKPDQTSFLVSFELKGLGNFKAIRY